MAVLSAKEIRDALHEGDLAQRLVITPSVSNTVQLAKGEASVDLRLGTRFRAAKRAHVAAFSTNVNGETGDDAETQFDEYYVPFGQHFTLHPRHFVLGTSLEYLRLPVRLHGYVSGRSSWGRRGLVIATAVGVHPGYAGCLTLELTNLGEVPLRILPGTRIAQLFLHSVGPGAVGDPGDASAYVGATTPGLMSSERDPFLEKLQAWSLTKGKR